MGFAAQAFLVFFLGALANGQGPPPPPAVQMTEPHPAGLTEPQETNATQQQTSESTREEELLDKRRQRLAELEPGKPSKVGQILATVENRGMEQFTTVQIEHFRFGVGQLSPGSRLTPAVQYSRPNIGSSPLRFQISGAVSVTGFQAYIAQFGIFEHSAPHDFLGDSFLGAPFHFDERIQEPRDVFLYADLMYRNMFRRNESCFEIRQKAMKDQIRHDLELFLADNCQAWVLKGDGRYKRLSPGKNPRVSAQEVFLETLASRKLVQN